MRKRFTHKFIENIRIDTHIHIMHVYVVIDTRYLDFMYFEFVVYFSFEFVNNVNNNGIVYFV